MARIRLIGWSDLAEAPVQPTDTDDVESGGPLVLPVAAPGNISGRVQIYSGANGELYAKDGAGNEVKITASGQVNAPGSDVNAILTSIHGTVVINEDGNVVTRS